MRRFAIIYIICISAHLSLFGQVASDFSAAARGGDATAQYNLAQCYRYGWGVESNTTSYLHYLRLSAEGGEERAKGELAAHLAATAPDLASYLRGEASTLPYDYTYRSFDDGCYYGEMQYGTRDGYGTFLWDSGTCYTGRWESGVRYGEGITRFDTMYIFAHHTGDAQGYGAAIITHPDHHWAGAVGSVRYVGYLENGLPSGTGTLYNADGEVTYYGTFVAGIPTNEYPTRESFSSYRWACEELPNGDSWEGEMVGGIREGFGIYTWGDGSRWYGFWEGGVRNGIGLYLREDGSPLGGTWENGELRIEN